MSDVAIRVENLGKMYRIGGPDEQFDTIGESILNVVGAPFRRARSLLRGQAYGAAGLEEEIWALKDVSFEVKHGEVLGIIGRNGAGKSTLLKVLSQITSPTEGVIDIYGRVGALLEVGTGFHQELTGRENVYLNGAILGMTGKEIDRKFEEIVEFAGVRKFIDTPVKHYSSGMRLRLGFAVAAHLEPEILIVDEVLAVGDAEFQKKCIGKMSDVASEGRTVLFVSHNLGAVQTLCERGIVLENGQVAIDSDAAGIDLALSTYMSLGAQEFENDIVLSTQDEQFELRVNDIKTSLPKRNLVSGEGLQAHFTYTSHYDAVRILDISIIIFSETGIRVGTLSTKVTSKTFYDLPSTGTLCCEVDSLPLVPGTYHIGVWCRVNMNEQILNDNLARITIQEDTNLTSGFRFNSARQGFVLLNHEWTAGE